MGVDLFFVLSGFVLSMAYGTWFDGHRRVVVVDYLRFMARRFARLWPLHATVLLLIVAGVLARRLRRVTLASTAPDELELDALVTRASRRPRREPSTGRYVLTLLAGAAVVAAITTPALAQTNAGAFAVPHGSLHSSH